MSEQHQKWLQDLKTAIAGYLGDDTSLMTADRGTVHDAMMSTNPQTRLASLLLIHFIHGLREEDLPVLTDSLICDSDVLVQQNAIGIVAEHYSGTCDPTIACRLVQIHESSSPHIQFIIEDAMSRLFGEENLEEVDPIKAVQRQEARFLILERHRRHEES